jgi:FSR family fosmidomycin resistance protein-like MFS transporter
VTRGLDRRALAMLGAGHLCIDLCQGAVPALLPFLARERGYSYAALGALLLFSTIGSSIIQPAFGILSDRFARPWLMPGGLALATTGIGLAGPAPTYGLTAAAVVVSGLGVAAFHPEGAKFAGLASRERRGRGMSLFTVGGNAGFAIGPLLTTPLVLVFGLAGTLALALLPLTAAIVLARELPRLRRLEESRPARAATAGSDDWGAFTRLSALIAARSVVHFGLQAFVPAFLVAELATSDATGNAALTLFLAMGAVGTLVGGGLVDRWGARTVLVGTMVAILPPLLLLPLVGEVAAAIALVGGIGFFTIASFSVTVVLGQAYLPSRVGLASGVTLGLAIGLGGVSATGLGVVADAWGLHAVLWTIAAAPVPAILLAVSLPAIPGTRTGNGRTPSIAASVSGDGMHAAPPQRVAGRRANG